MKLEWTQSTVQSNLYTADSDKYHYRILVLKGDAAGQATMTVRPAGNPTGSLVLKATLYTTGLSGAKAGAKRYEAKHSAR